jgi:hypothetical protein
MGGNLGAVRDKAKVKKDIFRIITGKHVLKVLFTFKFDNVTWSVFNTTKRLIVCCSRASWGNFDSTRPENVYRSSNRPASNFGEGVGHP